ncbi:hypothetical protein BBP40_011039 [Aspergillus hancockii]|nr:hypothetical protein BBP40_011039 [Aspergillus hancockii]
MVINNPSYSESINNGKEDDDVRLDEAASDKKYALLGETANDEESNGITAGRRISQKYPRTLATSVRWTSRTLSLVRTRESGKDLGPPSNGALASFKPYYTETLGYPQSDIPWVGSIQIFFIGAFSGGATDAGCFKVTLILGAVLELFCVFMTSLVTKYWQLFLAQGVGQGIRRGLMFCPNIALYPLILPKKRSIAMGIVASGSATGRLVSPAVFMRLLTQIGHIDTLLDIFEAKAPPRKSGPLVERAAFMESPYALFAIGMFLEFWGIYVGFYYIGSFAHNIIRVSQSASIDVLLVMNGIGLLGRLIPNLMADWYSGPLNLLIPCSLATGVVACCWAAVNSLGGMYAFSIFYGLAAAGIQSLSPATLSTLTTDLKNNRGEDGYGAQRSGCCCSHRLSDCGALVQLDNGQCLYAQMFMGSAVIAGAMALFAPRIVKLWFAWQRA